MLYFGGAGGGNVTENMGRMFIQLKPHDERNVTSDEVIRRLRPKMAQVEGAKFFMQSGQDISVGGRLSRTQYQYTLTDTDYDELNHWAPIVEAAMRKLPELQDVASDQQIAAPYMGIEIDRDAASRLGISLSLVDETLYDAFGQRQVATMYTSTNQYKVILGVKPEFQKDPTALSKIYVPGRNGAQVPLSAIAHYKTQRRTADGQPSGAVPGGDAVVQPRPERCDRSGGGQDPRTRTRAAHAGDPQRLVPGHRAGVPGLIAIDPAARRRRDPGRLYRAGGALRELYPPDHDPVVAAVGGGRRAAALMLLGYDLSVIAMIGVILLIGIVKKNAIMMIDFALQAERNEGKSPLEAIHEACLLRFRPIMMTTFAALFGAMPIAFGGGAGSELRRPLGVAMVGGLLVSQWLTLYTTPVVYLYLDRLARFLGASTRPSRLAEAVGAGPGPGWRTSRAARPNDCGRRRLSRWAARADGECAAGSSRKRRSPKSGSCSRRSIRSRTWRRPITARRPRTSRSCVSTRDGRRSLDLLRWGLIPSWAKDKSIGPRLINAMAETVATKPAFRDAFRHRRCLVPVDFFYEWQKTGGQPSGKQPGGKQPYAIGLADGAPMALAGLWERWKDPDDGATLHSFTVITGPPNELVAPIHNRMPVILPRRHGEAGSARIAADSDELLALLRPYPAEAMRAYTVAARVGNVRNNDPELLAPVAA